jgi:hypothetical protein
MSDRTFISPSDLVEKTIPPEVLEQLKILGRVKFTPQPTKVSAVSTAGTDEDQSTIDEEVAVSGLIDHVGEMEDLSKEIEDMIDDLTKDMAIPVTNNTLRDAVKSLGGDGNEITKEVFDRAISLMNHAPLLTNGYDPVLAALTGDGLIDGKFLNCNEVERSIAKTWNTRPPRTYTPEQPIVDETSTIADEHEKNLGRMILEILQSFFFNMLWAKYIVDLSIINPIRVVIAYPTDGVICFFKKMCKQKRFTVKSKDCLAQNGPVNKILNKIRCTLMCIPPSKMWDIKKFKPMVDNFDCDCAKILGKCPPVTIKDDPDESKNPLGGMENIMNSIFPDDKEPCISEEDIMGKAKIPKQDGLGIPPECLKHAKTVMEAVIADALSPSDPTKLGLAGTGQAASQVRDQTAGL